MANRKRWLRIGLVLVCVALVIAAGTYLALDYVLHHRVEGRYFDSAGVRLHYTDEGQGEPVILLHGLAAHSDLNWRWSGVTPRLSEKFRVIALDQRGHGLSDKPHDPNAYGIEMVHDVARLMDHLGIARAHVAGYSMGGFITLKFVTMYPERVQSALLCGAGWEKPTPENLERFGRAIADMKAGGGIAPLMRLYEPLNKKLDEADFKRAGRVMEQFNDMAAVRCAFEKFTDFLVVEEALRRNKTPMLAVVGEHDPLRKGAEALEGVAEPFDIKYIARGDHLSTPRMGGFPEAILTFVDKHRATPALTPPPSP